MFTDSDAIWRTTNTLKTLSGYVRFTILVALLEGEKSVGDLARLANSRDTAVSQQLAILRREHMVAARRDGQSIFYSLTGGTRDLVIGVRTLLGQVA